jgi:hypothetical protein
MGWLLCKTNLGGLGRNRTTDTRIFNGNPCVQQQDVRTQHSYESSTCSAPVRIEMQPTAVKSTQLLSPTSEIASYIDYVYILEKQFIYSNSRLIRGRSEQKNRAPPDYTNPTRTRLRASFFVLHNSPKRPRQGTWRPYVKSCEMGLSLFVWEVLPGTGRRQRSLADEAIHHHRGARPSSPGRFSIPRGLQNAHARC